MELSLIFVFLYLLLCLCLGSAITAYVSRTPQYEEYLWRKEAHNYLELPFEEKPPQAFHSGRSSCPSCKKTLNYFDLIPVFSFLISKGKCRHCHNNISIKYPLTEMACLIVCLPLLIIHSHWLPLLLNTGIFCLLISISLIDWQHQWIPDQLNLALLGLALCLSLNTSEPPLSYSVLGMMTGYLIILIIRQLYLTLRGIEAIGLGDAKLLAGLGAWQGLESLFYILFYASILGVIFAIISRKGRYQSLAFGPFLCLGAFIKYFEMYLF